MDTRLKKEIDNQLAVLISELEQCREDDRGANTLVLQVIAAGVAALAIVFALATSEEGSVLQGVHWLFPVFAVGIIIAVFSYATSLGIKSSIRYHYMRHLESEIIRIAGMNNHFGWNEIASPIITLNINHIRTSWAVKHYASIVSAVFMALTLCILIGMCFFLGRDPSFGALAIICVVPFLLLFLSNFGGTSNSLNMYNRALEIAKEKRVEKFSFGDSEKSNLSNVEKLIAYLVYPRPQDALKMLFILFGVCLGAAFSGENLDSVDGWQTVLVAFVVSFFVFDFLGYQARYQWNDIRGYNEDKNNPEEKKRGRLSHIEGKERLSPKLSFAVAVYRLLFAIVICWCDPLNVGFQLFICLLAIFLIAAVYEYARSKPETPTILMLILVSLGYPLRIFVGLWVACPNLFSMLLDFSNVMIFALLAVASILFGMVFVGLTWALEGVDHHIKRGATSYHKRHVDELALKLPGVFDELYPLKTFALYLLFGISPCVCQSF